MGCAQSTATKNTATESLDKATSPETASAPSKEDSTRFEEYELKKLRPGCSGMFWRSDPTKQTTLMSNDHWPRDGAKLRGNTVEVDGGKWLIAKQVQQKGSDVWHEAPIGSAMPFEYEGHYYLG
jgi:hypothetical protein